MWTGNLAPSLGGVKSLLYDKRTGSGTEVRTELENLNDGYGLDWIRDEA